MFRKYRLPVAIVFAIAIIVAIIAFGLPSQPISQAQNIEQNKGGADDGGIVVAGTDSHVKQYSNGTYAVSASNFGITAPVRDIPRTVANARAKARDFVSPEKRIEKRRIQLINEQRRAKGLPRLTEEEEEALEINMMNLEIIKKPLPGAGLGDRNFTDPLLENNRPNAPQAMPTPSLTFNGASQTDNAAVGIGAVLPPDVNGDVGPNHYVSSVNLVYKVFNKNGTVAAGPFATNALFTGLPANDPCRTANDGDPVVVYDSLADRWHISQFAVPSNPNNFQCVAVSVTNDPTGAYYVWSYIYPGAIFNDYPKVGVWPDAYHMTFNQFNNAGTAFLGAGIFSQDRAKALAGDPTASAVYTNIATIDPNAGGLLPADVDGLQPPPTGMAEVIGEYRSDEFGDPNDAIRFYRWVPNFTTPASSSITVLSDLVMASFDARAPNTRLANEVLSGQNLDSISDRMMHLFKYRNLGTQAAPVNSFTGNFTVNVSGVNPTTAATYQTGIRWFELRRTNDSFSVFDQGTHNLAPGNGASGVNNWMGSVAQDNRGNLALGFSQSSTTQRADIKIAGRTNNVANSGTLNEGEATFFAAAGSQSSTSGRWGDYSSMNVDPVDDCTFWYTQEYYASSSSAGWSTRVGSFKFPSCTNAPKGTISGTVTLCATGAPVNLASVSATGGLNRITGAPGTYSMTVAPGTYTVNASKGTGLSGTPQSGVVVVDGGNTTANICLAGVPVISAGTATLVSESCLPANGVADPGETVTFALPVSNTGGANTVADIGTLQPTGGVISPVATGNYGVITAGGGAVSRNFTFTVSPSVTCGTNITATVQHQDGASNLGNVTYTIPTGATGSPTTVSYTGTPVAIPDNNATGASVPLTVSGITGAISDINLRLDSLAGCSTAIGDVNASVTHTFLGDLAFTLTSPGGTTVSMIANRGSSGNNYCTVTLDDDGGFPATSTIPTAGAVAGNFAPESPLSAFDSQNPNGIWTLKVVDNANTDTGTINRFSLIITPKVCSTNCAPLPTPTPSPSPSVTPTPTVTPTPGVTPTPVTTPTPTPTPVVPTPTPTPTPTPVVPTPTPTPTPSPSPTPSPVVTPTPPPGVCVAISNSTAIAIPDSGPANPYPSNIVVSGAGGNITKVTVGLNGFGHSFPNDVDVMLVGPGGQNAIIMSDVGGTGTVTGLNLLLDDAAGSAIPTTLTTSGTFQPTNIGTGDTFSAPAPTPLGGSALSIFNGTIPNGTWSLYVIDDTGGDLGSFTGGWSLNISTTNCGGPVATPTPTPTPTPSPSPSCTPNNATTDPSIEVSVTGATAITNVNWPSTSSNFESSLCSTAFCGTGGGSAAPRTGTFYAWFGGTSSAEVGSLQQTLTVPVGSTPTLKYWLRVGSVAAPFDATLVVKVDGTTVQTITEPATAEAAYTQRSVSLPAGVANGGSHVIRFEYNNPAGSGTSNFTVDDITLETTNCGPIPTPTPGITPTPTASPTPSPTPTPGNNVIVSYTNPPVVIPDNVPAGVDIPFTGAACTISDLNFRFDGTPSATVGDTGVGVTHSWVGDLVFKLTSPQGTAVTFFDRPGVPASGTGCASNNLAQLILDDDGGFPAVEAQCGASTNAAFPSGSFAPNNPLSAFDGQSAAGTWTLNVSDNASTDTGTVRAFSLVMTCATGPAPTPTPTPTPTPSPTPTPIGPQITITNVTRNEGDSGTSEFTFEIAISRLPALGAPASSVVYTTVDGTATTADGDYVARTGTITFNSNSASMQKVAIQVNGDTKFEPNEGFVVRLSNEVNAGIPTREGLGLIFNDDQEPGFAVNDISANEGNSGTTPFVFTITRSGNATAFSSVVTYSTSNGTAVAPTDYTAITNGTVTFAPNETSKTVTVLVNGDTGIEPNETFNLNINSVSNGVITDGTGVATILDDEGTNLRVEGDVVDGSGGSGGDNLVLANDVNIIRQMQLGLVAPPPAGPQFQAADVNLDAPGACGNAQIDAGDVTVIRGYNLGLLNGQPLPPKPVCGPTAPATSAPQTESPDVVGRIIRAVNVTGIVGQQVTVQFQLDSQGDEASASFTANWNPAVLTYVSAALGNGVPSGTNLGLNTTQTAQGRLGVLLDSTNTYATGTRQILTVTFSIPANAAAGVYPITFSGVPTAQSVSSANGTLLATTYESGNVTINVTAAGVSVSGRVSTAGGIGVRGATVVITGPAGNRRSVTTGSFGFYSFDDVEVGQSYVISVTSKRYRFGSRVINVTDSLADVDFVGQQ